MLHWLKKKWWWGGLKSYGSCYLHLLLHISDFPPYEADLCLCQCSSEEREASINRTENILVLRGTWVCRRKALTACKHSIIGGLTWKVPWQSFSTQSTQSSFCVANTIVLSCDSTQKADMFSWNQIARLISYCSSLIRFLEILHNDDRHHGTGFSIWWESQDTYKLSESDHFDLAFLRLVVFLQACNVISSSTATCNIGRTQRFQKSVHS